jgi:hypothetical protein
MEKASRNTRTERTRWFFLRERRPFHIHFCSLYASIPVVEMAGFDNRFSDPPVPAVKKKAFSSNGPRPKIRSRSPRHIPSRIDAVGRKLGSQALQVEFQPDKSRQGAATTALVLGSDPRCLDRFRRSSARCAASPSSGLFLCPVNQRVQRSRS